MSDKTEKVKSIVKQILTFISSKPDQLQIEVSAPAEIEYYVIHVKSTYKEDIGRLIGKRGRRRITTQEFIGMTLRTQGYAREADCVQLKFDSI